ncbi:MAG: hypothetical protein Q9175_001362 [Cornicularia normoerica]
MFASDQSGGAFVHPPNGVERDVHPKQLTLTLPISRIKDLEIDNQGFDAQHPICNQSDMDCVLPTLLKRLPILQSFTYLGPLSAKVLAAIIQVDSLRVLQVRNGNDVVKVLTTPPTTPTIPWIDFTLDWSVLANLKGLQALEVGRLIRHEARGLATGVASLKLRRLHLSCWGWEYEAFETSRSLGSTDHASALVMFLNALTTLDLRGCQTFHGLPSTLQHLVLVDKYHTWIPSLHQLIATAILPCENLETLSTTINVDKRCYDRISKMGLPAYHKIIGLGSWQQLSCDEGMKVLHQYRTPSGETLQTNPYLKPLRNIVKTLDKVMAGAEGPGNYRMSMKFVKQCEFGRDQILVYPCEGEYSPCAAEQGPQARDATMRGLAAKFRSLSYDETFHANLLRFWGLWPN